MPRPATPIREYIQSRVRVEDRGYDTPCWIWQMALNHRGYACVKRGGKNFGVYRLAYEAWVGSIPEGLQMDHLCRITSCVNPYHVEPVTGTENNRRKRAAMTHCKRGHELSPENLMQNGPWKCCRICAYERWRKNHPPESRRSARTVGVAEQEPTADRMSALHSEDAL